MKVRSIVIGGKAYRPGKRLLLIAGPCVIETREVCLRVAEYMKRLTAKFGLPYVFKASYDKANRSSVDSYRGPGLEEGLKILAEVRSQFDVPVLSDVHECQQVAAAAQVLDVLQIPAFLSRQTSLIQAAARTGKALNLKKGQFLAPWDMSNVVKKAESVGNHNLLITERGACFGYNNLVSDMRAIPIMKKFGYPVVFDATHSVQLPGGLGTASGGEREMALPLALAAVAAGCDGLFLEVHPQPEKARCDAASMLPLEALPRLLQKAIAIFDAVG